MVPATHRQRHHPEIGLWSEAAVQPNFLAAIPLPSLKGAEVEKIEVNRLLQLVDLLPSQKDVRDVRLHPFHGGWPVRVELRSPDNPYAGRRNKLTPRQQRKRERMKKFNKRR